MSPNETYRRRVVILALLALFGTLAVTTGLAQSNTPTLPDVQPDAPSDLKCLGRAEDEVLLQFFDNSDDETNFRVERRIGNGSWEEIGTVDGSDSSIGSYLDEGIDSSAQNHFYRVKAYRAGDNSFSALTDICNNRRIFESDHFRMFYGLNNTGDACPDVLGFDVCLDDHIVPLIKFWGALEGARWSFLRVGFKDVADGGYDKHPANISQCHAPAGGCGNVPLIVAPYVLEYEYNIETGVGNPGAEALTAHELFHNLQGRYGGAAALTDPDERWITEGTASTIQDKVCFGASRADCWDLDGALSGTNFYLGDVNNYLGNPNRPLTEIAYPAALFWTYLTERFGLYEPSDPIEGGMDLIVRFWEDVEMQPGRDGITVLNSTLANMGQNTTFKEIWKDFAVASYAKDLSGPSVPDKYQYKDMTQPGGTYDPVAFALDVQLGDGDQLIDTDESVTHWGTNYYRLTPDSTLSHIGIKFTQDSSATLYYTVLGVKNDDLVYEYNFEGRDLSHFLPNAAQYDEVVIVVAGLEYPANYRYSVNGSEPSLQIVQPTTVNIARVGDPAAPDKFLAKVELVNPDGTPVVGVELDKFSFEVGSKAVPASSILTAATVKNQQWFIIRAPGQPGAFTYDFTVTYDGALVGESSNSVSYIPRNDADNIILLDRSGSMGSSEKLESAQAAARLYVDSWRHGDQIGVVSFNDVPLINLGLGPWTDSPDGGSREDAFDAINDLMAAGETAIGDALRLGWDELISYGDASHDWALILLSDGEEVGDVEETFDELIEDLSETTAKRPAVHAIAVGEDADRIRMQAVAEATGGIYHAVSVPGSIHGTVLDAGQAVDLQLALDYRYRMMAAEVLGRQPFFVLVGPLSDGDPDKDVVPIPVESGAAELLISLSWAVVGGAVLPDTITLRNPDNNVSPPFHFDERHIVWRVTNPIGGEWALTIEAPPPVPVSAPGLDLVPYLVQATVHSDITMELHLTTPVEERVPGLPMGIVVSLTDNAPLTGADVDAEITTRSGVTHALTLYDDGRHGEGEANDGLYGAIFYQTGEGGSYNVSVLAEGTSPINGEFVRLRIASFHLAGEEDSDLDGLPDGWENYFFGSTGAYDAGDDPDYDNCPNGTENYLGSNPMDPDTDDGGEVDCADELTHDPANDAIDATRAVAYPGDGAVYLHYIDHYEPIPTYATILRQEGRDDAFEPIHFGIAGGVFSDTVNIANDTTYCYMVYVSRVVGYDGTLSPVTCATPKSDPHAPQGYVEINDGAGVTYSREVTLSLFATDQYDPRDAEAGPPRPVGGEISGVSDMMISNRADMRGAIWTRYDTSREWSLEPQRSGLATVFVRFRDAAGNVSDIYSATIFVEEGRLFLPIILLSGGQ